MKYSLKTNYLCPHCRSYLRVWNNIIFIAKSESRNLQCILLYNPELGNYDLIHHSSIEFEEGEMLNFICPVCRADLTAVNLNSNLAKIVMIDENNREFDIYFSRICGEKSTFVIQENDIIEKFGEDSSSYVNYFMSRLKKSKPTKED
jgi:rubredoxin